MSILKELVGLREAAVDTHFSDRKQGGFGDLLNFEYTKEIAELAKMLGLPDGWKLTKIKNGLWGAYSAGDRLTLFTNASDFVADDELAEGDVIQFPGKKKEEPSKSPEAVRRPAVEAKRVSEKEVEAALRGAERYLDHEARYKQWDVSVSDKTVFWVTQETYSPEQKKMAARTLAQLLKNADIRGWTVKVTVRDDYSGYGKDADKESKWVTAKS
jgi:hypothetical protein